MVRPRRTQERRRPLRPSTPARLLIQCHGDTEPQWKTENEIVAKASFFFLLCLSVSLWPFLPLDKREVVQADCPTGGVVISEPWGSRDRQRHHQSGRGAIEDGGP